MLPIYKYNKPKLYAAERTQRGQALNKDPGAGLRQEGAAVDPTNFNINQQRADEAATTTYQQPNNNIKKAKESFYVNGDRLMFPSDLQGNIPYIYFKIFESEVGPKTTVSNEDVTAASFRSGLDNFGNVVDEYGTLAGAVYGAASVAAGGGNAVAAAGGAIAGGLSIETIKALWKNTDTGKMVKDSLQGLAFRRNTVKLDQSIFLAMPEGITVQYQQDYDTISVTNATGLLGGVLQASTEYNKQNDGLKGISPYLLEAASKGVEKLLGGENLQKLTFFGTTGMVVNPQLETIYTSPKLRTFEFNFNLMPRNQDESLAIANIIKAFKIHSSPTFSESVTTGRYFIPPNQFQIEFHDSNDRTYGSGELPYMYKTKNCVLTNIAVDYVTNGTFATFADGAPVTTILRLTFQETTILSRSDIAGGY